MRVNVYQIDRDTGAETLHKTCELFDAVDPHDDDYYSIRNSLETAGRVWLGGELNEPMLYLSRVA